MKSKSGVSKIVTLVIAVAVLLLKQYFLHVQAPPPPDAEPAQSQSLEIEDTGLYWGSPRTLQDHFDRHGADFDAADPEDYARQAHAFYLARDAYQTKLDTDGTTRVFDADTRSFGAYNRDGTTKTFFKPDDGQAYFDRQPGR